MPIELLRPRLSLAALLVRLGLAAIFIPHGYIKISVGTQIVPAVTHDTQVLVGWAELVCGILLLIGLTSRLAALVVIGLQVAAIALVTGKEQLGGLHVNRGGVNYTRVGPEYNAMLIIMALAVVLLGSGAFSVDHCLRRRRRATA